MIGKKIRLLILAVGIYALSVTGLRADVDWFPSGDKVNSQGFAVSSSGDYEEGDRIVNTALLDVGGGTAAGEELRAPSSKRFKTKKNKKWKTRGGEVEESLMVKQNSYSLLQIDHNIFLLSLSPHLKMVTSLSPIVAAILHLLIKDTATT